MWRGYPDPIVVHELPAMSQPGWDSRGKVYSVVSADNPWQQIGDPTVRWPAHREKRGQRFFGDPALIASTRRIQTKVTLFKDHAKGAKALRGGPDGLLYASEPAFKRIVAYSTDGDEKVVVNNVLANDIALDGPSHTLLHSCRPQNGWLHRRKTPGACCL